MSVTQTPISVICHTIIDYSERSPTDSRGVGAQAIAKNQSAAAAIN
jgi:hypothetical protein